MKLKFIHSPYALFFLLTIAFFTSSCEEKKQYKDIIYTKPEIVKDPIVDFLSPEETLKTMHLPEGYRIELVASEPMVNEPVTMAWDADGKLYVAEMLTYMQDVDGKDQYKPWSRIKLLEDTDGDGKMDKSAIFIDSIILPRVILPLDDRLIVGATFDRSFYSYRDTDGDNIADEKKLIHKIIKRDNSNLEHQPASMIYSIDNYMYLSKGSIRYRMEGDKIVTDTLRDAPAGQWGLTQDEMGQIFYSSAGSEVPALGYQQHPYYGNLEMKGKWEDGFDVVWPITGTPDVQGGLKRLREDGTLNHFTASCGQSIFLGDKLPAYGDLFIPEPVGRLIRRAKVDIVDGQKVLRNPYHETEFLASTDMNFRPVETKTGPDGCLYIVDMYRGIIQEGNWVRKGSFLRPVVERKKLDKNIGKGRIYRIVHDDFKPSKTVKLLNKSPKELTEFLGHANAWYRMNAQKLIVLKGDKSIIPSLKQIANNSTNALKRIHALWTLEGLDIVDENLILAKFKDEDPRVRKTAIRLSEVFLEKNNETILDAINELRFDSDKEVLAQVLLSLRSSSSNDAKKIMRTIAYREFGNDVIATTAREGLKDIPPVIENLKKKYILQSANVRNLVVDGYENFKSICASCHGIDGKGIEGLAPSLVGSPRVKGNWEITSKIVMNGLTGPIDGKEYAGVMAPMGHQDNNWLASVLTYIRLELNDASPVTGWRLNKIRNQTKNRDTYWTIKELYPKKKGGKRNNKKPNNH
jgi:glucose/arabinose dehydrogenase/mono/diheme cytochrome c family protein